MWDVGLPVVFDKYEQEEASGLVIKVRKGEREREREREIINMNKKRPLGWLLR